MKKHIIGLFAAGILIPSVLYAASAGTDAYLRQIGFSEEQLTREFTTEDREAFSLAQGAGTVDDPLGDVLDRFGVTSSLQQPWGDIETATLLKNDAAQTWDLTLTLGGNIPVAPTLQVQYFLYVDTDGDRTTNAPEGIRIGTDAEFSVRYDAQEGWTTGYRWYNQPADFWATNKETSSVFETKGSAFILHVPFAELPAEATPSWRVVSAIADGAKTQIDVAPGTGFPPPKGETYPSDNGAGGESTLPWAGLLATAAAVSIGIFRAVAKKRQT